MEVGAVEGGLDGCVIVVANAGGCTRSLLNQNEEESLTNTREPNRCFWRALGVSPKLEGVQCRCENQRQQVTEVAHCDSRPLLTKFSERDVDANSISTDSRSASSTFVCPSACEVVEAKNASVEQVPHKIAISAPGSVNVAL